MRKSLKLANDVKAAKAPRKRGAKPAKPKKRSTKPPNVALKGRY